MKKLFVAVLAVAGLAACNTEETVLVQGPAPIAFDGSFVETRALVAEADDPSTTTTGENAITGFDVWGFMDKAEGQIFDREEVTGTKGNFTYANTQYWVPGHQYYFAATAPAQSDNIVLKTAATGDAAKLGLGVVEFTVTDGAEDFLYSAVGPISGDEAAPVKFEFNHMLSKVKFTFTNGFANDLATIDVTNVRMEVPSKGTIKLDQADWWSTNQWVLTGDKTTLAFGDAYTGLAIGDSAEAADERIIFPANNDVVYTVTFDVALYQGSVLAYEGTKTVKIEGVALEIGKAYNFKAELNASNITEDGSELLPIVFDVEVVKDWVEAGDQTGVIEGAVTDQTLMADAEATQTVNLAGNLDGAGHTISAVDGVNYVVSNTARLIEATAPSTISNLIIDGKGVYTGEYGIRGIYTIGTGDVTISNVEILNCTYAINANHTGKLTVLDSTLQGWNSYGSNSENRFENVKFIDGTFHNFRPYNNTVCKNCDFGANVVIDLSCMVDGATITFDQCTVNGAALTAAHLSDATGKNVVIK